MTSSPWHAASTKRDSCDLASCIVTCMRSSWLTSSYWQEGDAGELVSGTVPGASVVLLHPPALHARRKPWLHRHLQPQPRSGHRLERHPIVLVPLRGVRAGRLHRFPLVTVLIKDAPSGRNAY